jgi:hypothetical protein
MHSPPHVATVIGLPTYDRPDIYTVSYPDGLITEYSDKENLLEPFWILWNYLLVLYCHLGLRGVLLLPYFCLICPNQDMELYFVTPIKIRFSVQALQKTLPNLFH